MHQMASSMMNNTEVRLTSTAMAALQFGCESVLVDTFSMSALAAAHAKRVEVRPDDWLVNRLCH